MKYKCQHCDPTSKRGEKPVKTIDAHTDDYIKVKNKYYHTQCYVDKLKSKNIPIEDINEDVEKAKDEQKAAILEAQEKDGFLQWIMDFYDGTLPSYFLKKVQSVRDGTHESLGGNEVTYFELLDIYQHMQRYLTKLSIKKESKTIGNRMNYDLAVVVGNIGDYRAYKDKQEEKRVENESLKNTLKRHHKVKASKKAEEDFDMNNDIDDLLL